MNLHRHLGSLAASRPIFHSEADFQHSLAWQIHLAHPNAKIRLEYRVGQDQKDRKYTDLWVASDGQRIGIELKYMTRDFERTVDGEAFTLANHAAHDLRRYDVLKDLERIEHLSRRNLIDEGWVIALANDTSYWQRPRSDAKRRTNDHQFKIHDRTIEEGSLTWGPNTAQITVSGRPGITLQDSYDLAWHDFSCPDAGHKAGTFRYLSIRVDQSAQNH